MHRRDKGLRFRSFGRWKYEGRVGPIREHLASHGLLQDEFGMTIKIERLIEETPLGYGASSYSHDYV